MKKRTYTIKLVLFCCVFLMAVIAYCQPNKGTEKAGFAISFNSLDDLLNYAHKHNLNILDSQYKHQIAKNNIDFALPKAFNLKIPTTTNFIINTNLQENYLKTTQVGNTSDKYNAVTNGLKYMATFVVSPQIDLLNLANIQQYKIAKMTYALSEKNNQLHGQQVLEQVSATYFSILSLNDQIIVLERALAQGEAVLAIASKKFEEGIIKDQDINEAKINLLMINNKYEEITYALKLQSTQLAQLLDRDILPILTQKLSTFEAEPMQQIIFNPILNQKTDLKLRIAEHELKQIFFQNVPTIAFFTSYNWQNLSNVGYFHNNSYWTVFNFIGLRVNWDLPTNFQNVISYKNKKQEIKIMQNGIQHKKYETQLHHLQLNLDVQKAVVQMNNYKKIAALKKDSYEKNLEQFKANTLSLDRLIESHQTLVVSTLNYIAAIGSYAYYNHKVGINNKIR